MSNEGEKLKKRWLENENVQRVRKLHRSSVIPMLFVSLVSLLNSCEGFTLPSPLKNSKARSENFLLTRKSRLFLTETESATESQTINISGSSQEALCFPSLSHEAALIMAKGDGAVDSSNDDDAENGSDETQEEERRDEEPTTENDEDQIRRRTGAAAAALLRRKQGGVRPVKPLKSTSIGARRVGSATRARSNPRSTSRIMDTVRTVASAAASSNAQAPVTENTNTTAKASEAKQTNPTSTSDSKVGNNVIQSTITSLLEGQNVEKDSGGMSMNALPRPFGILGEEPDPLSHELLKKPMPGTMLLYPTIQTQEYRRPSRETLGVRVATPDDDFQIANLRLSVFSDFSNELRSQFCARSCQVLADRRLRGATCLVATCPSGRNAPSEIIVGSVECSVHEFSATKLGRRRPRHSSLYITEVAVSPSARRCGVGSKLLQVGCRCRCRAFLSCLFIARLNTRILLIRRALTSLQS